MLRIVIIKLTDSQTSAARVFDIELILRDPSYHRRTFVKRRVYSRHSSVAYAHRYLRRVLVNSKWITDESVRT
ncbi:MAG TPA: hypothetical protein DIS79_04645 [Bacteroidetes bacterium]|nr:hypothetical protein [Bacteroidota bacterium]